MFVFFFQAEDGIRDLTVTGVQTCALPISECESAVVVAAAHAEAHAARIETHERQQHEVEPARANGASAMGFDDAEMVGGLVPPRERFDELDADGASVDARQEDPASTPPRKPQQGARIELFTEGGVDRDTHPRPQAEYAIDVARDLARRPG